MIGRRGVLDRRRLGRHYIRWQRQWVLLHWRLRFRFKGVTRVLRCHERRWRMRIGMK